MGVDYGRGMKRTEAQAGTFRRIQSYLGVEPTLLCPSLKKAVAKPLEDLIGNYDEVRSVLAGTPDEVFLHE